MQLARQGLVIVRSHFGGAGFQPAILSHQEIERCQRGITGTVMDEGNSLLV